MMLEHEIFCCECLFIYFWVCVYVEFVLLWWSVHWPAALVCSWFFSPVHDLYCPANRAENVCTKRYMDQWQKKMLLSNACAKPWEMWYLYSWWYGIFRTAYHFYHFTKAFTQKCKLLTKRFEKNNKIFLKPGVHLNLYFQIYIFHKSIF